LSASIRSAEPGRSLTRRDPVATLAFTCIGIGLAIAVVGSAYVIRENRAMGMPPRAAWTLHERNDELPVWPFFYSGTGVVAYGVLLLVFGRRSGGDVAESVSPRDTRAD
jgi:hypothetical protein